MAEDGGLLLTVTDCYLEKKKRSRDIRTAGQTFSDTDFLSTLIVLLIHRGMSIVKPPLIFYILLITKMALAGIEPNLKETPKFKW